MSNTKAGEWAIFVESPGFYPFMHSVRQVASVTPKLVKFAGGQWPRQIRRDQLTVSVDDETMARRLCEALNGVHGTYSDRERRAQADCRKRINAARDAARNQIARLIASVDTRRMAETALAGSGRSPSGAVPSDSEGDAPTAPSSNPRSQS